MEARTWVEVDRDVAELLVTIAPRCGLGADSRFGSDCVSIFAGGSELMLQ